LASDKISHYRKAVIEAKREKEAISCSLTSKDENCKTAIKKRSRTHKKKRTAQYNQVDKGAENAIKVYENACIALEKAEAKLQHAENRLYNCLVVFADVPEEHRDNMEYEFEPKHNLVHIFFGGYGKPKGEKHAHYGLNELTGEFVFRIEIGQKRTGRKSRAKYRQKELDYEESLLSYY